MAPLPLAGIGLASTAIGAGVSAVGSSYAGQAKSDMYNYQAGVADLNKKIASQNADYSREVGEVKAQDSGLRTEFQVGKMKAAQGGSGLDVNSGSALATRQSQTLIGQHDQGTIRSNAARQAYGFDIEAIKYGAEGDMLRTAGKNAIEAGNLGAVSSILGGASSVASKWLQGTSAGVWGGTGGSGGSSDGGYKPTSSWDGG